VGVTVADLVAQVGRRAPWWWAEPWDQVGLVCGEPSAAVGTVFASLDPTPATLRRAIEAGATVLLTHHPPFREGPVRLVAAQGMAGVPFAAVAAGVSLVAAHTNLDRAPEAGEALPAALGLDTVRGLEAGRIEVAIVTVYVPKDDAGRVRSAMAGAGAGDIGRYEGCAFLADGIGTFTPVVGSDPSLGTVGVAASAEETRLEMVCSRADVDRVLSAAADAHPYEEPVAVATEAVLPIGAARMGRVCTAPKATTLGTLAQNVATRLGVTPRVWGEGGKDIKTVAVAPGSGRSFVGDALDAGADVMVTGELRYHDALDALEAGLAVIEAGHDATEWPLVPVLARYATETEGLEEEDVILDEPAVGWWTAEGR
jgi:dinuclear metal center YbgI/SA1388 family protein